MKEQALINATLRLHRDLPPYPTHAAVGDVEINAITTKPMSRATVVSMRQAFLEGRQQAQVQFASGYAYHELRDQNGVWMTSQLQELAQLVPILQKMRGRILVGGLGLGVAASLIAGRSKVDHVTAVEIDERIVTLVAPIVQHPKLFVINDDVREFIDDVSSGQFDVAFFDTWRATGEITWVSWVVPLRRATFGKIPRVMCWQEVEMIGQIGNGLSHAAYVEADIYDSWGNHQYWVFRKACERAGIIPKITREILKENKMAVFEVRETKPSLTVARLADLYVNHVGSVAWEETFGGFWDGHDAFNRVEAEDEHKKMMSSI